MPVSQRSGVIASVDDDEAQRPDAGGVGDRLDRVRGEVIREPVVDEERQRREARDPDDGLEHPSSHSASASFDQ